MRHEVPVAAEGALREFAEAAMIRPCDFHLARRMAALCGERDERVELAFALTARELRLGSVCLDVGTAHELLPEGDQDSGEATLPGQALPWPEVAEWLALLADSPAVASADDPAGRAFRLNGQLLYLERFWEEERAVAGVLARRGGLLPATVPIEPRQPDGTLLADPDQDAAVAAALRNLTTVITGGPGTGKTTIVGRILRAVAEVPAGVPEPRVALMAPTAKASARLQESVLAQVGDVADAGRLRISTGTIQKLLGMAPHRTAGAFGPDDPLPYDLVVVDETSMVSLSLMRVLLDSLADTTRLVLVGDPQQLASVEAGAVLADLAASSTLVTSPAGPAVVPLRHNHRSRPQVTALAEAIRAGDPDAALAILTGTDPACTLVEFTGSEPLTAFDALVGDLEQCARAVVAAARLGDGAAANAALSAHRVLCAHREGHHGVSWWGREARALLAARIDGYGVGEDGHWAGQPLLLTRNTGSFRNGETAVVIQRDGALVASVDQAAGRLEVHPRLLEAAVDLHAMTIHKSQGSQFRAVSVVLPPPTSPLLTRELLYTAVTRAQDTVRVYGTTEALARAVMTPIRRASGLGRS